MTRAKDKQKLWVKENKETFSWKEIVETLWNSRSKHFLFIFCWSQFFCHFDFLSIMVNIVKFLWYMLMLTYKCFNHFLSRKSFSIFYDPKCNHLHYCHDPKQWLNMSNKNFTFVIENWETLSSKKMVETFVI